MGAPVVTVTAGDAQLSAAVTGDSWPAAVYSRTPGSAWTSQGTLAEAGSKVVGTLTNGQVYEILAVAADGTPGTPATGVPTDGTNTPDGPLSKAIDYLRDMVAASSTWQAWTETISEAAAKAETYAGCIPEVAGVDYTTSIKAARPFVIVAPGEEYNQTRIAGGARNRLNTGGSLLLYVEADVPAAYAADTATDEAYMWFIRQLDGLLQDIQDQSGEPGKLSITGIQAQGWPVRSEKKKAATLGDYFEAYFSVQWGI